MKLYIKSIVYSFIACCSLLLSSCDGSEKYRNMTVFLSEVKNIRELYLLRVYHGDFIKLQKNDETIKSFIYAGTALIGIDLNELEYENASDNRLIIKLPVPTVREAKLIESECYVLDQKQSEYVNWKVIAEDELKNNVCSEKYIASAKEQAEQLFEAILGGQGYKVEIRWK